MSFPKFTTGILLSIITCVDCVVEQLNALVTITEYNPLVDATNSWVVIFPGVHKKVEPGFPASNVIVVLQTGELLIIVTTGEGFIEMFIGSETVVPHAPDTVTK